MQTTLLQAIARIGVSIAISGLSFLLCGYCIFMTQNPELRTRGILFVITRTMPLMWATLALPYAYHVAFWSGRSKQIASTRFTIAILPLAAAIIASVFLLRTFERGLS